MHSKDNLLVPAGIQLDQYQTLETQPDYGLYQRVTYGKAQTFKAGITGTLYKVILKLCLIDTEPSTAESLIVEIRTVDGENKPTSTVLATKNVLINEVTSEFAEIDIIFSPAPEIVAGTTYAIVLRTASGNIEGVDWRFRCTDADVYPYGAQYGSDDNITWAPVFLHPNDEIYFKTYVSILESLLIENGILKRDLTCDSGVSIILRSTTKRWRLLVDESGNLTTQQV